VLGGCSLRLVGVEGSNRYRTTLITIQGTMSWKALSITTVRGWRSTGSWPGSTRSTAIPPFLGPSTPGGTPIIPDQVAGSQIAPTLFGELVPLAGLFELTPLYRQVLGLCGGRIDTLIVQPALERLEILFANEIQGDTSLTVISHVSY
jgi:hypothetical protein